MPDEAAIRREAMAEALGVLGNENMAYDLRVIYAGSALRKGEEQVAVRRAYQRAVDEEEANRG
jgi:hypothetical protein